MASQSFMMFAGISVIEGDERSTVTSSSYVYNVRSVGGSFPMLSNFAPRHIDSQLLQDLPPPTAVPS